MNLKKWMILVVSISCIVGSSLYTWGRISDERSVTIEREVYDVLSETDKAKIDYVVVYDDGEYTSTISKEEYDTLS